MRDARAHVVLAVGLVVVGCRGGDSRPSGAAWVREERDLYNGIPSVIELEVPGSVDGAALVAAGWAEFERVGRVVDAFDPASEVGRLNAAGREGPIEVSTDLRRLIDLSRALHAATDGAFDPTVWPLKQLWREAAPAGVPPDAVAAAGALARVGLSRVEDGPDGGLRMSRPGIAFDFGGIAKGYAVDRVASLARAAGVRSGLIQCGGEVQAWGRSPDGTAWRIGVRHPAVPGRAVGVISGPDPISVSTSGNYEQPVVVGGRTFHHVVDPRTGVPVDSPVLGVTVAVLSGPDASARADALATALTVVGVDRGLQIAESMPGVAALFLVAGPGPGTEVPAAAREVLSSRMEEIYSTASGR